MTTVSKAKGTSSPSPTNSTSTGLSKEKGIELLVEYLDAVYSDPEGWAELANVYAGLQLYVHVTVLYFPCRDGADHLTGSYAQSLAALSHLILLAPHNPYHLLHHAETAYTLGDFPLAYKELLRVIEMSDGVTGTGGVGRRAAIGVKLVSFSTSQAPTGHLLLRGGLGSKALVANATSWQCIARLQARGTAVVDPLLKPQKVKDVDLLVSKLILDAYSTPGAMGVATVRKWIGGTA